MRSRGTAVRTIHSVSAMGIPVDVPGPDVQACVSLFWVRKLYHILNGIVQCIAGQGIDVVWGNKAAFFRRL